MVLATAVPSMRRPLPCKIHRPRLPDHHDPDLSRILEIALDLAGDLLRELSRAGIVYGIGRHDHAHLASRLDGEDFLDALELRGDLLELGEALYVGLERFAARARPRPRDGVGR